MDFILAVDIGTTHVKALAIDLQLEVIDEESIQVTTYSPEVLFQEQDPDELLEACEKAVSSLYVRCGKKQIQAIVFSNAMHSIIPVDQNGNALSKALIWSDLRASQLAAITKNSKSGEQLYLETGTPIHPMSPLFKILWLRENMKDTFKRTNKFLSVKEYILSKWFNVFVTDYSTASASGLFDINKKKWSKLAMETAGIAESYLPDLTNIYHSIDAGGSTFLRSQNIPQKVPVIIGATDGCLAVLGGGNSNLNDLSLTIGTSAAIRLARAKPLLDSEGRLFNYYLDSDTFITGGPSNNGGNLLKWAASVFMTGSASEYPSISQKWSELIKNTSAAADGLIFLPYIFGERAPIWQPAATGSFHGIRNTHTPEHFARSVIEGMIMNIRVIAEILVDKTAGKVIISGGFFNIPGTGQLIADIFEKPVQILNHANLSARGAAILGWRHLGSKIIENPSELTEITPNSKYSKIYSSHFGKFKALLSFYQDQLDL